ncbi:MAG: hypothetical protein WC408_02055 [Candidatus Micrarchaeia archaeon]|jgi:V/A-type H+-transporting ATPase subunit K
MVEMTIGTGIAYIAAALPICVGAIATGMAMSSIGAAAMGYMAEKDGNPLIYVALPETMVILGFVLSYLLINAITASTGAAAAAH